MLRAAWKAAALLFTYYDMTDLFWLAGASRIQSCVGGFVDLCPMMCEFPLARVVGWRWIMNLGKKDGRFAKNEVLFLDSLVPTLWMEAERSQT